LELRFLVGDFHPTANLESKESKKKINLNLLIEKI
jgi:hypothetical protein